eukprot:4411042-Prymnesium_polylepis.1
MLAAAHRAPPTRVRRCFVTEFIARAAALELAAQPDSFFYRRAYDVVGCRLGPLSTAKADAAASRAAAEAAEAAAGGEGLGEEDVEGPRAGAGAQGYAAGPSDDAAPVTPAGTAGPSAPATEGEAAKRKPGAAARLSALEALVVDLQARNT